MESSKDNNVVLSSTSLGGNTLLDSFRHDAGLKRPATPKNKNANPTCIEFGVKSRYLVVGDECGAVCLWDLKKKARVRHYFHSSSSGYSSSLQATLDPTDSNVLSLSETSLNIFRLREATLAATITGTSRFCKFSTSPLEPRNVAIGGRIGNVDLYDVSLQNKILSMSPHTGPITGVAMSKVSKLLVASASMDETLAFSDTASGNTVQQMKLGSPATSMSFHDNGRTCAVGTESGRVLVYDLRKTSDVIATCEVVGRVSCVQFAPGNGTAAANTTKPRRSTLSLTDSTEQDHTSSSVDELGRVVDSVLNRSRDSSSNAAVASKENKRPTVPLATSQSLDKVRNTAGKCNKERTCSSLVSSLLTLYALFRN